MSPVGRILSLYSNKTDQWNTFKRVDRGREMEKGDKPLSRDIHGFLGTRRI
jgi:hypothetical protein